MYWQKSVEFGQHQTDIDHNPIKHLGGQLPVRPDFLNCLLFGQYVYQWSRISYNYSEEEHF